MLIAALVVAAGAAINHARGGGFGADRLPGHPRYYAAVALGAVALAVLQLLAAAAFALSYLAWSWAPWGRWFDLGRMPAGHVDATRSATWFERLVGRLPGDHARFTARNLIALAPGAVLTGEPFAMLALAVGQLAAYEGGWRLTPAAPIRTAELITGALWGLVLLWCGHV